ncbi:MAG: hypothetical protein LUF30_01670 [Lachnospiraceae bacterium]|nr:hypothetical protein [Lachnospiraceae bacterium]
MENMAIEWKRLQLHQGKSDGKETDVRADIRTDTKAGIGTETRTTIKAGIETETKTSIETDIRENIKAGIKTDGKINSKTGVTTDIRKDIRKDIQAEPTKAESTKAEPTKADHRRTGCSGSDAKDGMDEKSVPSSDYLVACEEGELIEYQKQLLFDVLGPVFFGEKQAGSREELADLFWERYGIDVRKDFCEGDEHYEEYREAQQAIAEGMSIYGGRISFGDCVLAELAGTIWEDLEKQDKYRFRRINTMLEE